MTPEQKKAKEIVLKYANLPTDYIYIDGEGDRCVGSGLMTFNSAKACAIEEVKAVIAALDEANAYDLLPSIEYYEKVLTEIEKLLILNY